MSIYFSKNWWQYWFEIVKCQILRLEIWLTAYCDSDEIPTYEINRLIEREKYRYPGKTESWYLTKIINDLQKTFFT